MPHLAIPSRTLPFLGRNTIGLMMGTANPAYIEAMRLLRRSGVTVPHQDRRQKRSRTRQASKQNALRTQTW